METLTKETVIIVHGTWAAPPEDEHQDQLWYGLSDQQQEKANFVSKLNNALEQRGSPARCWAHCKVNDHIFSWSGENAWIDRTRASLALAAEINELQADGWRCHVVAHSHGGNVVAEALPALIQTPNQPAGISGTITTLGSIHRCNVAYSQKTSPAAQGSDGDSVVTIFTIYVSVIHDRPF
jgi:hypothetical protein